ELDEQTLRRSSVNRQATNLTSTVELDEQTLRRSSVNRQATNLTSIVELDEQTLRRTSFSRLSTTPNGRHRVCAAPGDKRRAGRNGRACRYRCSLRRGSWLRRSLESTSDPSDLWVAENALRVPRPPAR